MATVAGIVGGLQVYHAPGMDPASFRKVAYLGIQSGYATAIGENSPVKMAGGYLTAAAGTNGGDTTGGIVGTFLGVEYTDAQNVRQYSNWWPASTTGTNIVAYYTDNPYITYQVQANGAVPNTNLGYEIDFNNVTVNTTTGQCTGSVDTSTISSGSQRILRIVGMVPGPLNAWNDAFTVLLVQIAKHQYVTPVVGVA